MSGIFGVLQKEGYQNDCNEDIKRLNLWNRAYGRDIQESVVGENFGIGCCYEKLSERVVQSKPVIKRDKRYIVIDAVLYNREAVMEWCQISDELSDEELLLAYIDMFGMDALARVNGDFAGAVYEFEERTLVLFRDHMGVRPLYYYADANSICFSTDIRGVLSLPWVNIAISEEWLYTSVAGYANLNLNRTEYEYVFCVEPASYVSLSFGEEKVKTLKNNYWQVGQKKIRYSTEKEYCDRLRELITDAVKRRADVVPGLLGAELSGGLDSGTIDLLLCRMGRKGIFFSWSENPDKVPYVDNDERLIIRDICEQEQIVCHYNQQLMELDEYSNIYKSMQAIGVPMNCTEAPLIRFALPPYMNTLNISKTSQFVKEKGANVVFTGHGGDEGVSHRCNAYEMFYNHEYIHYFKHMYLQTEGQKRRVIKTFKKSWKDIRESRKEMKQPFREADGVPQILKKEFVNKFSERKMQTLYFAYDAKNYVRMGGSRNRLDNVALQGAYSGVRYMIPYLDYRVIDFALSIPRYLYLKKDMPRYIFREAFKDIMPQSLYTLKSKTDFSRRRANTFQYDEFCRKKREVLDTLDRKLWGEYLNFELLEQWLKCEEVSQEEITEDRKILTNLFKCAVAQNLVEKSRQIRVE